MSAKVCSRCKEEKSLGDFYKDARKKDGLYPHCKSCHNKLTTDYERRRYASDSEFRQRKQAANQRWAAKNPDKVIAYRTNEEFKDHRREYMRDWRDEHEEHLRVYDRSYKQNNRPQRAENQARRNARKRLATIEPVDFDEILERDGLWCYLCQSEVEPDDIHFDHVVPLSKGGMHTMDNIRVTHSVCNLRKGDRLLEVAA